MPTGKQGARKIKKGRLTPNKISFVHKDNNKPIAAKINKTNLKRPRSFTQIEKLFMWRTFFIMPNEKKNNNRQNKKANEIER